MDEDDPYDTIFIEDLPAPDRKFSPLRPVPTRIEDHARFIPINKAAISALNEIAAKISVDSDWNFHARRFVHITTRDVDDANTTQAASDLSSDDEREAFPHCHGYYRLNLTMLPRNLVKGWILSSRVSEVDLLITLDGQRDDVRGRHARVYCHRESRVPMIQALPGKMMILDGDELVGTTRTTSIKQGIAIGNLAYRLEFLEEGKSAYNDLLKDLMHDIKNWFWAEYSSFDPTPSNQNFVMQGYDFRTPQAAGTFGIVSACVKN